MGHSPPPPSSSSLSIKKKRSTSFKDVLYDEVLLTEDEIAIVDTEEFQQLRKIKQLGACCYVWPSANHTRFEHSLGTCHLAGKFMEILYDAQKHLPITPRLKQLVRTASLVHDIGHSIWSHAFDNCVADEIGIDKDMQHHESRGGALFRYMNRKYRLNYTDAELDLIASLICGVPLAGHPRWLFDILANKRNELDVDKLDYINRDSHTLGLTSNRLQITRIMKRARVINDTICYPAKSSAAIMEVFSSRYNLYLDVYNHRVVHSIECMIRDILMALADVLDWRRLFNSETHEWRKLNDSVIDLLPWLIQYGALSADKLERLRAVLPIYERLQRREFYPMIAERLDQKSSGLKPAVATREQLAQELKVSSKDIDVISRCIGLSSTLEDPFQHIHCYLKDDTTQAVRMSDLARVRLAPKWPFTQLTHVYKRS